MSNLLDREFGGITSVKITGVRLSQSGKAVLADTTEEAITIVIGGFELPSILARMNKRTARELVGQEVAVRSTEYGYKIQVDDLGA